MLRTLSIGLLVALVWPHLLCVHGRNSPRGKDGYGARLRLAQTGLRTIDALSKNCGRYSAMDIWNKHKDAFCSNSTSILPEEPIDFAAIEEFPSLVHLTVHYTNAIVRCLGVLVHPDAVLTANSCVGKGAKSAKAKVGIATGDLEGQVSYAWGYCRLSNKRTFVVTQENNVVLILLRKAFSLNERVQSACLEVHRKPNARVHCYAAGTSYNRVAKSIQLHRIPYRKCSDEASKTWPPDAGHCYYRISNKDETLANASLTATGTGLFCLDKCQNFSVPYVVGVVSNSKIPILVNDEKPNLVYEFSSISKLEERETDVIKMLENCHELVSE